MACEGVCKFVEPTEPHNTAGLMRRHIYQGFTRATLVGDETDLANFLTFGFAELDAAGDVAVMNIETRNNASGKHGAYSVGRLAINIT